MDAKLKLGAYDPKDIAKLSSEQKTAFGKQLARQGYDKGQIDNLFGGFPDDSHEAIIKQNEGAMNILAAVYLESMIENDRLSQLANAAKTFSFKVTGRDKNEHIKNVEVARAGSSANNICTVKVTGRDKNERISDAEVTLE